MNFIDLFIFFILGTIIGSFINVVVLRYQTGRSIITGRSHCFSCGKKLVWYELIPIFSFLFLKGRCSDCKSRISSQYPLVELITGLVFVAMFWRVGLVPLLFLYLAIGSVLVAIAVYDFKHKIIPTGMVYSFNVFALIILFINNGAYTLFSTAGLPDFLAGPLLFTFFAILFDISDGKWMGFGDAKLALGVGWLLGISGGIFAIILAFWIGAIWSLAILALEKLKLSASGLTIKSEVPFAPFIILALFLTFLTQWNLTTLINVL